MIYIMSKGPYTLYKHTAPDGRSYIGVTEKDPLERWNNGNGYKGNEPFFDSIQDYGWDSFTHEILQDNMSDQYAHAKEAILVAKFHCLYPDGFNLQGGGKRGYTRSQYVRDKISQSLSKPIAQIHPETGEILKVWPSVKEAATELYMSAGDISDAAHDKGRHTAGGFKWKYIDDIEAAG